MADAEACAAIVNAWIDGTDWMPRTFPREVFVEMMEKGIPIREFWVIGDPVAGYLSLNAETSQIMGLYTSVQGQGLGKALMDRVKEGRDYLQLRTHEPNAAAHRFYAREGFEIVEHDPEGTGDGLPEYRMEWRA